MYTMLLSFLMFSFCNGLWAGRTLDPNTVLEQLTEKKNEMSDWAVCFDEAFQKLDSKIIHELKNNFPAFLETIEKSSSKADEDAFLELFRVYAALTELILYEPINDSGQLNDDSYRSKLLAQLTPVKNEFSEHTTFATFLKKKLKDCLHFSPYKFDYARHKSEILKLVAGATIFFAVIIGYKNAVNRFDYIVQNLGLARLMYATLVTSLGGWCIKIFFDLKQEKDIYMAPFYAKNKKIFGELEKISKKYLKLMAAIHAQAPQPSQPIRDSKDISEFQRTQFKLENLFEKMHQTLSSIHYRMDSDNEMKSYPINRSRSAAG